MSAQQPNSTGSSKRKGKKKGEDVKASMLPTENVLSYGDSRYQRYDFSTPNIAVISAPKYRGSFAIYNDYRLISGWLPLNITPLQFPTLGVRLDDRLAGLVFLVLSRSEAGRCFPAEFDVAGMIRARRCPLGDPMLMRVDQGTMDVDGSPAPRSGFYYARQKGLQLLCGNDGIKKFMVRPSNEAEYACFLGFKVKDWAVTQEDRYGTAITPDEGKQVWSKLQFSQWYNQRHARVFLRPVGRGTYAYNGAGIAHPSTGLTINAHPTLATIGSLPELPFATSGKPLLRPQVSPVNSPRVKKEPKGYGQFQIVEQTRNGPLITQSRTLPRQSTPRQSIPYQPGPYQTIPHQNLSQQSIDPQPTPPKAIPPHLSSSQTFPHVTTQDRATSANQFESQTETGRLDSIGSYNGFDAQTAVVRYTGTGHQNDNREQRHVPGDNGAGTQDRNRGEWDEEIEVSMQMRIKRRRAQ